MFYFIFSGVGNIFDRLARTRRHSGRTQTAEQNIMVHQSFGSPDKSYRYIILLCTYHAPRIRRVYHRVGPTKLTKTIGRSAVLKISSRPRGSQEPRVCPTVVMECFNMCSLLKQTRPTWKHGPTYETHLTAYIVSITRFLKRS